MRIVIALGGNALLRRGEPAEADTQRRNVAVEIDGKIINVGLPVEFLAHGSREQVLARVGLTAQRITQDTVAQVLGAKVPYARPVPEDAAAPHHQEQA